jgi:hypothetical protein
MDHFERLLSSSCKLSWTTKISEKERKTCCLLKLKYFVTKSRRAQTVKAHLDKLANKFERHTMQVYQAFYRNFVSPIESSITSLKNGLTGLRAVLKTKNESFRTKESGKLRDVNENDELCASFHQRLGSISLEKNQKVNIFGIFKGIDHIESVYMKLVNAKMQNIQNTSPVLGSLSHHNFKAYDAILNVCNQIWQKQEDPKKKRQAEEESFYVTITKCMEEDEETVKLPRSSLTMLKTTLMNSCKTIPSSK